MSRFNHWIPTEEKLGLSILTALVLSSMLGAGVFNLPQNTVATASPAALLIGRGITGTNILLLAFAMLALTHIHSEFDDGIFTYAREGFGGLIGFCSARGCWLCAVTTSVFYLVIAFSVLNFFTDAPESRLSGDGNTWQSVVDAPVLLWIVYSLILRGVQIVVSINLVAILAKLLPLGLFVVLVMMMFKLDTFKFDFIRLVPGVSMWEQVKDIMLITLQAFIGVEGAAVIFARARNKRDVGKATLLAALSALGVYLLVTLLSLGVMARSELAEIRNPSMTGSVMEMVGPWDEIIIAADLIVSVCGAYLSWIITAAGISFLAAAHKIFPRIFARQNVQATPSASLWLTNICVQAYLVLIWLTGSDYNTLLAIASEMILVPYLLVGAFSLRIAARPLHKAVGVGACIHGLQLLYTSGSIYLLLSVALYTPGLLIFLYARKTYTYDGVLNRQEMVLIGMLLVTPVLATRMLVG